MWLFSHMQLCSLKAVKNVSPSTTSRAENFDCFENTTKWIYYRSFAFWKWLDKTKYSFSWCISILSFHFTQSAAQHNYIRQNFVLFSLVYFPSLNLLDVICHYHKFLFHLLFFHFFFEVKCFSRVLFIINSWFAAHIYPPDPLHHMHRERI